MKLAITCTTFLTACSLIPTQVASKPPSNTAVAPAAPAPAASSVASLPAPLRDLIETQYADAQTRENAARPFVSSNEAFAQAWKAYEARRAEVTPQIAAAHELAATDRAAAMQKLLALVTNGPAPLRRQWVEAIDAEYPAAVELTKLAVEAKDFRMYVHGLQSLIGRRPIEGTRDAEQMRWFAFHDGGALYNLQVGLDKPRVQRVKDLSDDITKLMEQAIAASGAGWRAAEGRGLKHCFDAGVKQGDWCWDVPYSLQVHGRTATEHMRSQYTEAYDCVDTNRFYGWDPLTGVAQYYQNCQHRQVPIHEDVVATLAEDAPADVAHPGILGHVKKAAAGNVVLDDAIVLDVAALGTGLARGAHYELPGQR